MRKVLILGATGSIGEQALDVVERNNDLIVVGLSADSNWEKLLSQAERHRVDSIALTDQRAAGLASESWDRGTVHAGHDGLIHLIAESDCDIVLNAIVGSAGLGPTIATLGSGIDLALANKESLVVGGDLVMQLAEGTGAQLIPVDSEHSALFQLVNAENPGTVDKLVLTASGGPFRGRTREQLSEVTVDEALKHPTWEMGGKITIDSATLMNKGLEIIEAHHLFGMPYDAIDAIVHPQSIIHSLIHLNDGATMAHLGYPDMRVPISYALNYPSREDVPLRALDLAEIGALTFEPVDREAFECIRLAEEAGAAGGSTPCVMNAANEIAVAAFLAGDLPFLGIAEVIERTMDAIPTQSIGHFSHLATVDEEARIKARQLIAEVPV
jgi:1-deoxy-D-xylulose-5-phosphate reductoisomerase